MSYTKKRTKIFKEILGNDFREKKYIYFLKKNNYKLF